MKGLLLKDLHLAWAYCRIFLFLALAILTLSVFKGNNMFYLCYPIVLASAIPHTLLSYDEKEKWNIYSRTLPCSKAQIVQSKYLFGLLAVSVTIVVVLIFQVVRMIYASTFHVSDIVFEVVMFFAIGLIIPAVTLPFMFYLGTERGRILNIGGTLIFCVLIPQMIEIEDTVELLASVSMKSLVVAVLAVVLVLYVVSCMISTALYKRREV